MTFLYATNCSSDRTMAFWNDILQDLQRWEMVAWQHSWEVKTKQWKRLMKIITHSLSLSNSFSSIPFDSIKMLSLIHVYLRIFLGQTNCSRKLQHFRSCGTSRNCDHCKGIQRYYIFSSKVRHFKFPSLCPVVFMLPSCLCFSPQKCLHRSVFQASFSLSFPPNI